MEIWTLPDEWELPHRWLCTSEEIETYLLNHFEIAWIEADLEVSTDSFPDDPVFLDQWPLNNSGQNGCDPDLDIGVSQVWEKTTGSKEVLVGITDTGIDWQHPDLANNIWQNLAEDADGDGHVLEYINGQWQLDPGDLDQIDQDGNGYVDDLIGWDFVNHRQQPHG